MLFKPELCQAILAGRKTQTRRLVQEGEFAVNQHGYNIPDPVWGDTIDAVYSPKGTLKWQVGRTYAIQPSRGKKAVGRFLLLSMRREKLQPISEADIEAEGVIPYDPIYAPTRSLYQAWIDLWRSIHTKKGTRWLDNPEVWALQFGLVEKE